MGKSDVNSVGDAAKAFLAGIDAQIKEAGAKSVDTVPFDKAVLEQIGTQALKKAIDKLSFAQLYNFLKECGFKGDKKRLAELLAEKGLRNLVEMPERLKKKCECGYVLIRDINQEKKPYWGCVSCGKVYRLSKGVLTCIAKMREANLGNFRAKHGWNMKAQQVHQQQVVNHV